MFRFKGCIHIRALYRFNKFHVFHLGLPRPDFISPIVLQGYKIKSGRGRPGVEAILHLILLQVDVVVHGATVIHPDVVRPN